jgi:hypothetical protein
VFFTTVTTTPFSSPYYVNFSGINNAGEIVGIYEYPGDNNHQGFLLDNGTFSQISYPGAYYGGAGGTSPNSINDSGEVVGVYNPYGPGYVNGFTFSAGAYATVIAPGGSSGSGTNLTGVNDSGEIVGWNGDSAGFVDENGVFTPISFPGAVRTDPYGLNSSGDIVGFYVMPSGVNYGFIATPSGSGPGAPAVPEPGTLTLLGAGAIVMARAVAKRARLRA